MKDRCRIFKRVFRADLIWRWLKRRGRGIVIASMELRKPRLINARQEINLRGGISKLFYGDA